MLIRGRQSGQCLAWVQDVWNVPILIKLLALMLARLFHPCVLSLSLSLSLSQADNVSDTDIRQPNEVLTLSFFFYLPHLLFFVVRLLPLEYN